MKKMTASVREIFWMVMDYGSRQGGETRQIAKAADHGSLASIDLSTIYR